ncbi:hypothetical protein K439DRAFT_894675 [Ramaria rubella]|nr:hypothetical protein K439DRAFT_894675 [Ramaria rubella]
MTSDHTSHRIAITMTIQCLLLFHQLIHDEYDSSYHGSFDDDESDWEDEDESGSDDDLPPLEPVSQDPGRSGVMGNLEEDIPSLLEGGTMPPSNAPTSSTATTWLPPRRTRSPLGGGRLIPVELLQSLFSIRFDSFPVDQPAGPSELDLARAKLLVNGLERVSGGLLARIINVGGAPGAYQNQSDEDAGVTGCAICWAPLLDDEALTADPIAPLPFASSSEEIDIVCLPCAHVFHSTCLLPWFSRKTSCPTCRFNIDPDSLTQKRRQRPPRGQHDSQWGTTDEHVSITSDDDDINGRDIDFQDDVTRVLSESPPDESIDQDFFHWTPFLNGAQINRSNLSPHLDRSWTLPDPPDRSLREHIEDKERELGLRCLDATCIFGPTDENPHVESPGTMRKISIKAAEKNNCQHMLHSACLVLSARVAGWKRVSSNSTSPQERENFSAAEVSCPSCRAVGTVSREEWEEGVGALARDGS